jgi:SAUR family protein
MMMPLIKLRRCRSWPDSDWKDMAPEGYFAVYVGPDRARFVIKTESVNHPLFRMLLEEAEKEYGFDFAGPLTLPCEVSVFRRIMDTLNIPIMVKNCVDSVDLQ